MIQKSNHPVKLTSLTLFLITLFMFSCINNGPDEIYTISPSFKTGNKMVYEMVNFVLTSKDTHSIVITYPLKPETQPSFSIDSIFDTSKLSRTIISQEKDSNGCDIVPLKIALILPLHIIITKRKQMASILFC